MFKLALLGILISFGAHGAVVLKYAKGLVLLSASESERVHVGGAVSLETQGQAPLKGIVVKIQAEKVAVQLKESANAKPLNVGDVYLMRSAIPTVGTTGLTAAQAASEPVQERRFMLGAGANFGLNYINPALYFEVHLEDRLTVGAMPVLFFQRGSNSSVTGIGAFATMSYYFSKTFEGFGAVVGPGVYSLSLVLDTSTEDVRLVAAMAQLVYRTRISNSRWYVGGNLGAQYVISRTSQISLSFQGLLPMLSVYASCNF